MLKVHSKNFGNIAILCLRGKIVNGETATLRQAVAAQSQAAVVVLDLARINTVDAAGLGLLLELRASDCSVSISSKVPWSLFSEAFLALFLPGWPLPR